MQAASYEWPPKPRASQPQSIAGGIAAHESNSNPWDASTAYGSSSNPWDHPSTATQNFAGTPNLAQLQRQTEQHATAIKESEQRMLRMAESAAQTGAATLEQLHVQGEQLRHIRSTQQKIDDDLSTTDRLLRGMESWRGAARNAFSSLFGDSGEQNALVCAPSPAVPHASCSSHACVSC